MEIYIRITSDDDGYIGWWTFDPLGESYLVDGRALWTTSKFTGEEYTRGTACKNIAQAKREAKIARDTAGHDGIVDPKVSFWRKVGSKYVETKFTSDNKLRPIAKPVVLKDKDVFEPYSNG